MDSSPLTSLELFAWLADKDQQAPVIWCANQRLIKTLQTRYAHFRRARGDTVWNEAPLSTFEQWLEQQASQRIIRGAIAAQEVPELVLSPIEAQRIWQQIIETTTNDDALLNTQELAKSANDAHSFLLEFNQGQSLSTAHEGYAHYARWAHTFQHLLRERDWLTTAQWQQRVVTSLCKEPLPLRIVTIGFDHKRPWQKALEAHCLANGGAVYELAEQLALADITLLRPKDTATEHRLIACWARQHLKKEQSAKLAIVVTDLAAHKVALMRALRDELEPQHVLRFSDAPSPLINCSLGEPLSAQPMIATALRLLRALLQPTIRLNDWSALWLSPHLGFIGDTTARLYLDRKLREEGVRELKERHFLRLLSEYNPAAAEKWQQSLSEAREKARGRHLLSQWSLIIRDLLLDFGWPGTSTLESTQYQIREAFFAVLLKFGAQRWPEKAVSFSDALRELQSHCQETVFQAEQPGTALVQVMGLLEAAGVEADAIWLADARGDALPAPLKPNPLLPFAWQQSHELPRASHTREQNFARNSLMRLRQSAPQVWASCPQFEGDAELEVSPFLADCNEFKLEQTNSENETLKELFAAQNSLLATATFAAQESLTDAPVPLHDFALLSHRGSSLLGTQAINPQLAFAQYRLHANVVPAISDQLQANERGNLVHLALESFWRTTVNSAALHTLTDEELNSRISAACDFALSERARKRHEDWPEKWRALEHQSLCLLLLDWLSMEKMREGAFTVVNQENAEELNLCGLPVRVRVDRKDQLDSGDVVVVDYKTGKSWRQPQWEDARPSDPQLMLYALTVKEKLGAVVAGQVLVEKPVFAGLSDLESFLVKRPKNPPERPLDEMQTVWRETLESLAQEFIEGHAKNCSYGNTEEHPCAPFIRQYDWQENDSEEEDEA